MTLEDHIINVRYWDGRSAVVLANDLNRIYVLGRQMSMKQDELRRLIFNDLLGNYDLAPLAGYEFDIARMDWPSVVGVDQNGRQVAWEKDARSGSFRFFVADDLCPRREEREFA